MDGAGGPTSDAVATTEPVTVASAPRLVAYPREEVEALVAEALRTRALLREQLDDARHEELARQVPQPLEVVPRDDADDALRQLEGEVAQLRAQLAATHANIAATPAAPPIPVVVPLSTEPAPATYAPLPVELQPTGPVPIIPAAPIVERVIVERPFSKTTGLLQVVVWSVIVAVVLIVLLAWFA